MRARRRRHRDSHHGNPDKAQLLDQLVNISRDHRQARCAEGGRSVAGTARRDHPPRDDAERRPRRPPLRPRSRKCRASTAPRYPASIAELRILENAPIAQRHLSEHVVTLRASGAAAPERRDPRPAHRHVAGRGQRHEWSAACGVAGFAFQGPMLRESTLQSEWRILVGALRGFRHCECGRSDREDGMGRPQGKAVMGMAEAFKPTTTADDAVALMVRVLDRQDEHDQIRGRRDWAIARSDLTPGASAVDVGSGTGVVTRMLADLSDRVAVLLVVEPHPALRELAIERAAAAETHGATFVEGTAAESPLPDGSVDVVWCSESCRHLSDPVAALREMHRVLRRWGSRSGTRRRPWDSDQLGDRSGRESPDA